jgi:hypothetical protein
MQPAVVPNNGSFWTDKIIQGAFGAASGGLMTGSLEVLRPAAKMAFGLHGEEAVNNEAVRGVLKTIQADQRHGGPTFQDMLDIANATPAKPLVVADVGASNLKGMMGRIARTPGDAKQIMAKFLNDRDIDAATRVTGDINQTLGAHAAYYVDQALMDARRAAANPLYEKAFANHEPLDSEYLQHLLDTNPRIQAGMRKGWAIERDEAQGERRPLDATTYGITSIDPDGTINLGQVPNLKLWNVVKKGLDRQIEEHTDKVTGQVDQEGRAIGILKNGMLTELDRLSPDYKAARMAWGGLSESRKALDAGKNIFKMEPEVIDEMVSKMTPNDRQFFQLGAANTIRKMVQKTAESGNEVRPLMVDYTGRQMRAMFQDDKAFERFFAGLNAEHMMWKTWRKAYGGSETAERLADDSAVDANQLSHGIRAGRALMNNDKLSAVSHAFQAAGDWINKVDPRVGVQQSRLLTMPLPQAVRILQGATNKTAPIPKTPKLGGAVGAVAGAQDR